jgi:hypothetical protein
MTDTSRNQNNIVNTVHIYFYVETQCGKKSQNLFFMFFCKHELQVINFRLNMHPPVADNEETNPLRNQPITDNDETNPLKHQPVTKMRTPILSELQLTLAPPCHPKLRKISYIT